MYLISVITISFNNLQELINTCNSVDQQIQTPFEHLIIDGSTNQDIRNYLEQNPHPPYRKWICEPDNGISDAFNKGIQNSKGDIIVLLNSGDAFINENLINIVSEKFEQDSSLEWLHGMYSAYRGNTWVTLGKPFEKKKLYRGMRSICHQTMFVKKHLHFKHELYDVNLKFSMDYDFLCRIANEPFTFLRTLMVAYAPAGRSSENYIASLRQTKKIYIRYFGKSLKLDLWQIRLKLLHYLLQSPLGNFLYRMKTKLHLENM
jgi:glycosyltransferase involved in cell wall biosynthesis